MNYAIAAFATRARGNWVTAMTDCVHASGAGLLQKVAFEAFDRSKQIAVIAASRFGSDL